MNASTSAWTARGLADIDIIGRVVGGERNLFAVLMQRYNQRLFRLVRSIVRPDAEAEDALQDAYVNAFARLASFEGRSTFSTWMSKIAIRTARARRDRVRRTEALFQDLATNDTVVDALVSDPQDAAASGEVRTIVEAAIDRLPETYRCVVVARLLEELSTAETADLLGLSEDVVRIRLHRGRAALRRLLSPRLETELASAFAFAGHRCNRIVANVLQRLSLPGATEPGS